MRTCYVRYLCQPTPQELKCSSIWMTTEMDLLCWHTHRQAAAMTGRLSGLIAPIKEFTLESQSTHCIIHREMLASQKMLPEFTSILNDVVKVINHVKAHALSSHLFE